MSTVARFGPRRVLVPQSDAEQPRQRLAAVEARGGERDAAALRQKVDIGDPARHDDRAARQVERRRLPAGVPQRHREAERGGGGEAERIAGRGARHPDQDREQHERRRDPRRPGGRLGWEGEVDEHPGAERHGEPGREALPLGFREAMEPARGRSRPGSAAAGATTAPAGGLDGGGIAATLPCDSAAPSTIRRTARTRWKPRARASALLRKPGCDAIGAARLRVRGAGLQPSASGAAHCAEPTRPRSRRRFPIPKHRFRMSVRTRFAPSPTGFLHIGGARTALFNFLFARHHGGTYLLRIEDTDRARCTEDAVKQILDSLDWLGLPPDEPPVFQSRREARHAEVARELLAKGRAYLAFDTPEELQAARERAVVGGTAAALRRRLARPRSGDGAGGRQAGDPAEGAARGRDRRARPGAGRGARLQRRAGRHDHPALGRHADLSARRRGGRPRHGHHPRDPRRRPPDQHLPAMRDLRRDGLAAARTSRMCR